MTIGNFGYLRNFLTRLSAMTEADQLGFVQLANIAAEGQLSGTPFDALHSTARTLIKQDGVEVPASDLIRWTRWTDAQNNSGIALTLAGGRGRYVLLPEKTDPPAINFDHSLKATRLLLFANLESLSRSGNMHMAYVHRDFLYTSPRPPDDIIRYARLLRLIQEGLVPPIPSFYTLQGASFPYWLEDRHGSAHWGMLALQRGMQYVLGKIESGEAPYGMVPLDIAASSLPSHEVILGAAPDLKDACPASACFGAGDPRYHRLTVAVRGQKILEDAEGKPVGWAHIVAGGHDGRHADPISGMSAATSEGGRDYQEDGFYLAHFRSTDVEGGRDVRVFVTADGLGGAEMGEMASSAALQGVHAGIVRDIRERRLPLAGDLFEDAREALEAQVLMVETRQGKTFPPKKTPDTVISVCVVVDGLATIATAGDVITALCAPDFEGRLRVMGYTIVDSSGEHSVHNTLRGGRKRLYRASLLPGSRLLSASDGSMEGLAPSFKRHTSPENRQMHFSSYPEQSLFHNLVHVLEHAPAHYAGPALHDASAGSSRIPGGGNNPDAVNTDYPGLVPIIPEMDNWTAVALHWEGSPSDTSLKQHALTLSETYGPLEPVHPTHQYIHEDGPYWLEVPGTLKRIFVGSRPNPEGRPTIVMADQRLAPVHLMIERAIENDEEHFYVTKMIGAGRISLLDQKDNPIAALTRKGSRHEVRPGDLIRLTPRSFFRLRKS